MPLEETIDRLALDPTEARRLTDEVKADAAALWGKLLALYEGNAHGALDYLSWGAYYEAEFGQSHVTGYRILEAARVVALLPSNTHVSQNAARELVPVLRDDPERVEEVWAEVVQEHGPEPTATEVRQVVQTRNEPKADGRAKPTYDGPLEGRTLVVADAARRRIEKLVGTCQGLEHGLDDVRVELAARTVTEKELADWRHCIRAARKALLVFERRIPLSTQENHVA